MKTDKSTATNDAAKNSPKKRKVAAKPAGATNGQNHVTEESPTMPQQLEFNSDKGSSRSTWIAAFLVVAIVAWMGSGFVIPSKDPAPVVARSAPAPVSVAVAASTAKTVTQYYQAEGQALPDRDTMMRAETSGNIIEVLVEKGQDVKAGDAIARFDPTANKADTNRALEELALAEREFANAQALQERGVATTDKVSQTRATLAAAQAQVAAIAKVTDALTIRAPFDGRIETLNLDAGEYVTGGTEVGRLVDITPLTIAIQVPQQSLTLLTVGQPASVAFITGETRVGTVTFVGTSAASETRTFLAEIEVPNDAGEIPAGISAEVIIPTGETIAHFLSPSIVSLNTIGDLGVKTVDKANVVAFYPVKVVKAQLDGIWVTGLPETVDLITVGQGFVNEGETVAPSAAEVKP